MLNGTTERARGSGVAGAEAGGNTNTGAGTTTFSGTGTGTGACAGAGAGAGAGTGADAAAGTGSGAGAGATSGPALPNHDSGLYDSGLYHEPPSVSGWVVGATVVVAVVGAISGGASLTTDGGDCGYTATAYTKQMQEMLSFWYVEDTWPSLFGSP